MASMRMPSLAGRTTAAMAAATMMAGAAGALVSEPAGAQEFPNRVVRIVVPNSAGTILDLLSRAVAPDMSKSLGQPVIVENKPGANNIIGLEYVAKQAPADGHTIVTATVSVLATLPILVKDLRFDPHNDLPPLIGLVDSRTTLSASAKMPYKTFKDMVAHAKANPGKLNYGDPSPAVRLVMEIITRETGINVVRVPYAAAGPYQQAVAGGEVQIGIFGEAAVKTWRERINVLAVTGTTRLPSMPDTPTFAELGLPQVPGQSTSMNLRAGTPKPVIDKLYAAVVFALSQPEVKSQFAKLQSDIAIETPDVAARKLAQQAKMFGDAARAAGINPQ
ncbi:MAG: tripartite tricarboxylate transporter substrate binding protein [Betaproteobacteria bacterium]|nr:tripartite tricarboxylate transporter substrate binding protein [Betaproteobacteria bacterium]